MSRADLNRVGRFFHNYINQVPQQELLVALRELGDELYHLMQSIQKEKMDFAYAPGKWTLREVFQHIIDTERILGFRALSIARKEPKPLPGFEENDYVMHSKAGQRSWDDMLKEYQVLRNSTILLFSSFDDEQLEYGGVANNNPLYVRGLGFIIAGHCQHHTTIIRERYLS